MKEEQKPIQLNSEGELAIFLHLQGLKGEYERIVKSSSTYMMTSRSNDENRRALELIEVKINQCTEAMTILNEYF